MNTGIDIIYLFVTVFTTSFVYGDEKWIWSKESQSDYGVIQSDKPTSDSNRRIDDKRSRFFDSKNDDLRQARYEVQELEELNNARPFLSVGQSYGQRPSFIGRPEPTSPFRPFSSGNDDRFDYNLQAAGNEPFPIRRQPPPPPSQSVGILTGPVPSWEKPTLHKNGDPTNFEHCKCSFSFNCKSPGIQFGSCDQGKTYCCYNEVIGNKGRLPPVESQAFDSSNIDRFYKIPAVLAGPGGPIDRRQPSRPSILSPPPYRDYGRDR